LRTRCMTGIVGDACSCDATPMDCTCGGVSPGSKPPVAGDRWVAVRYKELPSRPVRIQPAACGCDDTRCEYSRWRDGYEICVLDKCPASHATPPDLSTFTRPQGIPDCPDCPTDPWLVLAKVTADEKGNVMQIDNCACRRMLLTTAPFWWRCNETPQVPPSQPTPTPGNPTAGGGNQPG